MQKGRGSAAFHFTIGSGKANIEIGRYVRRSNALESMPQNLS
jgi:hypothetical protein